MPAILLDTGLGNVGQYRIGAAKSQKSSFGKKQRFGVKNPVGINISSGQIEWAEKHKKNLPIRYINCDYRDVHMVKTVTMIHRCKRHTAIRSTKALFVIFNFPG